MIEVTLVVQNAFVFLLSHLPSFFLSRIAIRGGRTPASTNSSMGGYGCTETLSRTSVAPSVWISGSLLLSFSIKCRVLSCVATLIHRQGKRVKESQWLIHWNYILLSRVFLPRFAYMRLKNICTFSILFSVFNHKLLALLSHSFIRGLCTILLHM